MNTLDRRVDKLEMNVEHLIKDVDEVKVDVRKLSDKFDDQAKTVNEKFKYLNNKIDNLVKNVNEKFDTQTRAFI